MKLSYNNMEPATIVVGSRMENDYMGKMDERILVVERDYLFENENLVFQGVLKEPKLVKYLTKKFEHYEEIRRGDAEETSSLKQPIPYAVITRGSEVFLYRRLSGGGEKRLHDQLSIGVGGHMNRINDVRNWNDNLMFNFCRELNEELSIKNIDIVPKPEIVGLINDDYDEAGIFHIGILMVLNLPEEAEVYVLETDKHEGYWIRIEDLKKSPLFESLESWSKYAVEGLF